MNVDEVNELARHTVGAIQIIMQNFLDKTGCELDFEKTVVSVGEDGPVDIILKHKVVIQ